MAKPITWVGIDDDKLNLTVAVLKGSEQKEPEVRRQRRRTLRRLYRRSFLKQFRITTAETGSM